MANKQWHLSLREVILLLRIMGIDHLKFQQMRKEVSKFSQSLHHQATRFPLHSLEQMID